MKIRSDPEQFKKTKGDNTMALVKLRDPSAKTPIDLGNGDVIKRRGNTHYTSSKPDFTRRKRRAAQKMTGNRSDK
jgi:hypothetical protein